MSATIVDHRSMSSKIPKIKDVGQSSFQNYFTTHWLVGFHVASSSLTILKNCVCILFNVYSPTDVILNVNDTVTSFNVSPIQMNWKRSYN